MYCIHCGNKINNTDNFCTNCGNKVEHNNKTNNFVSNNKKNNDRLAKIIITAYITMQLCIIMFGVNYRINEKIRTIKVPYANQTIEPNTKITSNMISYIEIPEIYIRRSYNENIEDIENKCSNYNTIISKGSLFYDELIENCDIAKTKSLNNDLEKFYKIINAINDNYNQNETTIIEQNINIEIEKLDKYYNKLNEDNKNINNYNLDEQIISKFIIAFNQASILYESIKDNTFLTNLEKFNNDSELFEEYYVTFLDNYDY